MIARRQDRGAQRNGDATDEVFALENGALRQLSHQNDAWLAEVQLATTEDVELQGEGRQPRRTGCW